MTVEELYCGEGGSEKYGSSEIMGAVIKEIYPFYVAINDRLLF